MQVLRVVQGNTTPQVFEALYNGYVLALRLGKICDEDIERVELVVPVASRQPDSGKASGPQLLQDCIEIAATEFPAKRALGVACLPRKS